MELFRIKKETETSYSLLRKLPPSIMNGEEVWDIVRANFVSPWEAETWAYKKFIGQDSIVKEFVV